MSLCNDCIRGVTHEGTPKGAWEVIGGVNTYVATPRGGRAYPRNVAILFLPDAYGPQLINSRLLADDFASNGFQVFIPDYLDNDPLPPHVMVPGMPKVPFDIDKWLAKHGERQTRPLIDALMRALREERGIERFAAVGYCFGGKYVFDLACENIIQAAVVAHPSLLNVPGDFEKYVQKSRIPLLMHTCPIDSQFPPSAANAADSILGNGKFAPGYVRLNYDGCRHGFTIRGDLSDPVVKKAKEDAFKATVAWLRVHLCASPRGPRYDREAPRIRNVL
ncbi:hypothetical protein D9613_006672 [Agrocybe pediades]|uniref:Dienelactone hydrolase domain-containing protein n=1 Tax=Agrocybe pediades TaxID=84607 RepID=A0A8H4QGR2_9AGAR|nr:hypothetical protein D9613_006672 [Agrocybe pediades]